MRTDLSTCTQAADFTASFTSVAIIGLYVLHAPLAIRHAAVPVLYSFGMAYMTAVGGLGNLVLSAGVAVVLVAGFLSALLVAPMRLLRQYSLELSGQRGGMKHGHDVLRSDEAGDSDERGIALLGSTESVSGWGTTDSDAVGTDAEGGIQAPFLGGAEAGTQ